MSVERRLSRSLHACLKGEGDTDGADDGADDWDGELGLYPCIEDLSGLRWEDVLEMHMENGNKYTQYPLLSKVRNCHIQRCALAVFKGGYQGRNCHIQRCAIPIFKGAQLPYSKGALCNIFIGSTISCGSF